MFTQKFLRAWWRKALRRRVLYKALNHEDRGYLWLSMNFFDNIRSIDVGVILVKILAKLNEALKNSFTRLVETYGYSQARRLSRVAVEWGYNTAKEWATEPVYIKHLTNNELNTPPGYGIR